MIGINRVSGFLMLAACSVVCAAVISACEANRVKDEASPFYSVAVGSTLMLNREISIAGDQVAVYVQNGEVLREADINKYQPNCKFEIYTIDEKPRSVQAGSFEIIKVEDNIESSSIQQGTQLASLDHVIAGKLNALGMLDRSEVFNYATMMYLRSDKQPDVFRMTCQHWESVLDDRYLSISQMRTAMGEVFTLIIKNG